MKRTLDVMVVPVGREPEPRTLESDENGSFLKALQGCVGGLIEPLPWLFDDAPAGYCNEEGALGATFLDANRAVYATKAMEDAGFLSQLDFRTPVREGDLYAIVFGDMVFTGFDPETGESRDISPEECELQGYRAPSSDEYGFARICQVMGNFFGGSLSLGVGAYTTDRQMDPGDNGIYVIEGWRIADHLRTEYDSDWNPVGMRSFGPSEEEDWHKFDDMLRAFDASMPEELRLGELLDSVEVPASELQVGDEVWMYDSVRGKWEAFPVVGFGQPNGNRIAVEVDAPNGGKKIVYPDMPYVAHYDHDGDFSWNCNNYVHGDMARIRPRAEQAAA